MSLFNVLSNELWFIRKDRPLLLWVTILFCLSSLSVIFGLLEVKTQQRNIQTLIQADQQERAIELAKHKDWGNAAYYSFHLTYDPPSDFAFAALGQRDQQPWKHRIRMLALEGQIYERDVANPSVALIGRFDFSFLVSFIMPLVLIVTLYDLRTGERTAGRFNLLESTARNAGSLWLSRAFLRVGAIYIAIITPLIIAGFCAGTSILTLTVASILVVAYVLFWSAVIFMVAAWQRSSSVILMTLVSVWVFTAAVIPASAKLAIDKTVPLPSGTEILMLQRETVNAAWDLPKQATMDAFFKRQPEWLHYEPANDGFEWPWYYAFQQVGDQTTEHLSAAYTSGRLKRDGIAAWVSLLAPPSFFERRLQALADTDLQASIAYEQSIRAYHAELRAFYYPNFYNNREFDDNIADNLPVFSPNNNYQ